MAVTINASTSAGAVTTADTSGVLQLQTGGTTALTVNASQNVGIGTSSPATNLQVTNTSATTNATVTPVTVQAMTSGTAANGFGSSVEFNAEASDGASYAQTTISSLWTDATAATRSSALTFATRTSAGAITERARIDSSGNLLVGNTTNDVTNGGFVLTSTSGVSYLNTGHINGTATGNAYSLFRYNGTIIGRIDQNGTTAVSYNTTSDYRLKDNIMPLTGALARVAALKPCTYTWKAAPDEVGEGFIAHELAEVCPQATTGEKDAVDADGKPVYQGIDTSFLVATLTAAIQEQQALITQQAEAITALTTRITALEGAAA